MAHQDAAPKVENSRQHWTEKWWRRVFPKSELFDSNHRWAAHNAYRSGKHDEAIEELKLIVSEEELIKGLDTILISGYGSLLILWRDSGLDQKYMPLIEKYTAVAPKKYQETIRIRMEEMRNYAALNHRMTREEYIANQKQVIGRRLSELMKLSDVVVRDGGLADLALSCYGEELIPDALSVIENMSPGESRDNTYASFAVSRFHTDLKNSLSKFDAIAAKIVSPRIRDSAYIEISHYMNEQGVEEVASRLSGQKAQDELYSRHARIHSSRIGRLRGTKGAADEMLTATNYAEKVVDPAGKDAAYASMIEILTNNEWAPPEIIPLIAKISQGPRNAVALNVINGFLEIGKSWSYHRLSRSERKSERERIHAVALRIIDLMTDGKEKNSATTAAGKIARMKATWN